MHVAEHTAPMPQIVIRCCPMIGQSSAGPRSASQFMHHRGGKFIFKGNVSAEKWSDERRRPPCGGCWSRLHISASGASPRVVRRHLQQYRHAPTGLFIRIYRMKRRVRTNFIRCIKPKGNAMQTRLTINGKSMAAAWIDNPTTRKSART